MVFLFHNRSVLEVASGELEWTQQDLQITNQLATALTNFVKYRSVQRVSCNFMFSVRLKIQIGNRTRAIILAKHCSPLTTGTCSTVPTDTVMYLSSSSMRPFFPHEHTFWHETIAVVDQLTYTGEYRHYNPLVTWIG